MIIGPKYKICKRLGASVFEKCQTQKFALAEARGGVKKKGKGGARGGSDFGAQLLEKQKARFTYGLSEKQFSRYVKEAMEKKGVDSAKSLVTRLELRLDNVVYRLGLAKTRRQARQLVSHGHVTVNGRKMTVPSHGVGPGDTVAVRPESRQSPLFKGVEESLVERRLPLWLSSGEGDLYAGTVQALEVPSGELGFNPSVIIQFYSR
ncbi:MAG TPA: 30S ribosomal protein S4 [Candidatus Paceibacterota bacterium]